MYEAPLRTVGLGVCLAVLAAIAFTPPALATGDSLFTFRFGTKAELVADGDAVKARLPITLAKDVAFDSLRLEKAGVRRGDTTSQAMLDAFEVALLTGPEELGNGLEVTVDLSGGLEAGSYKVGIDVTGGEARQTENLEIVIPSATLSSSLENLTITRVVDRFLFFDVLPVLRPDALVLAETGGKSRIRAKAAQIALIDDKNQPIEGFLTLDPPSTIGPGKSGPAAIAFNGDLPLGRVTGKLEIRAPELAAPQTIGFSVLTRRGFFWIFLCLSLGVYIGHLVRVRLQAAAEKREAEVQAYTLKERMFLEHKTDENREIASDIKALMETLQAKIDSGDAAEITTQIPLTDEKFRKLADALAKRRVEVQAGLKSLEIILKTAWQLPTEVRGHVDETADLLPDAAALIKEFNFSGAEAKLASLRRDLVAQAMASAREWRDEVRRPLNRYQEHRSVLLDIVKSGLGSTTVGPALTALAALPLDPARPESVEVLLGKIHDAERVCVNRTDLIFEELRAFCDYTKEELAGAVDRLVDPDAVKPFETAYSKLIEKTNKSTTWKGVLESVIEAHDAISVGLQNALAGQLAKVKPEDLSTKTKLYEALEGIKRLPSKAAALGHVKGVGRGKKTDADDLSVQAAPWRHHPEATPSERVEPGEAPRLAPHPSVLKARSNKELARIKRQQLIISGILIGFVGFFIYQGSFVGTWTDLAKIFFWGFGLDLGFDKVLALATTKIK